VAWNIDEARLLGMLHLSRQVASYNPNELLQFSPDGRKLLTGQPYSSPYVPVVLEIPD
jgi:hypothetical protein